MAIYHTQFLIVREIAVDADDELQAEREAYRQLQIFDQGAAIAVVVMQTLDEEVRHESPGGALDSEDNINNWVFARETPWA